jgi:hypothetical protein
MSMVKLNQYGQTSIVKLIWQRIKHARIAWTLCEFDHTSNVSTGQTWGHCDMVKCEDQKETKSPLWYDGESGLTTVKLNQYGQTNMVKLIHI